MKNKRNEVCYMAKLRGIKKIDRIINNFTKNFNIKADLGEEFLAYCDDRLINYTLVIDEAEEVHKQTERRKVGRILLKGDNITLIQMVGQS